MRVNITNEQLEAMKGNVERGKKQQEDINVPLSKKRTGKKSHKQVQEEIYNESNVLQQTIIIKPLSVNEAWQGRRFKTDEYKAYEKAVMKEMSNIKLNVNPPFAVMIEYGFSNSASDIDNPTKLVLDILQKKYKFNDKDIYKLLLIKTIIAKGKEYFRFRIQTI